MHGKPTSLNEAAAAADLYSGNLRRQKKRTLARSQIVFSTGNAATAAASSEPVTDLPMIHYDPQYLQISRSTIMNPTVLLLLQIFFAHVRAQLGCLPAPRRRKPPLLCARLAAAKAAATATKDIPNAAGSQWK